MSKLISAFLLLISSFVFAGPGRTTYQAKIVKPDGYPLESVSVNFRFTILDPSASCVLYVEDYAAVDMTGTRGLISFALGMGTKTYPTSGTVTFEKAFDNSVPSLACQSPGVYNPMPDHTRSIVMQFNDGNGWQTLPAMAINAVPYSMFASKAQNSEKLNGKADTNFVEYATLASLNCQANEAIKFNGVSFSCIAVGASGGGGITSVTTSGTVLTTGGTASAPVISIQMATGAQSGYLSSGDWTTFNNKQNATSGAIIATLGYTPADNAALSALNSTVSSLQAATATSTTLLTNNVNSVSSAVASLQSSTAASLSAITSSQWVTSGTSISYAGNNVGVGTSSPISGEGKSIHLYNDLNDGTIYSNTSLVVQSVNRNAYVNVTATASGGLSGIQFRNTDGANTIGQGGITYNHTSKSMTFVTSQGVRMSLDGFGNVGLGVVSPTAKLHIAAGTSTNAPLKFNPGTLLSSPQSGTVEYDGSDYYFTDSTNTRRSLSSIAAGGVTSAAVTSAYGYTPANSATVSSLSSTAAASFATTAASFTTLTNNINSVSSSVSSLAASTAASFASVVSSQWTTSGTNIFYNTGSVGIGTSAPTALLNIKGGANSGLAIDAASANTYIDFRSVGVKKANMYWDATNSRFAINDVNAGPTVLNTAGGNVGIGTVSPTSRLHVEENVDGNAVAFFGQKIGTDLTGITIFNYSPSYATTYMQKTTMLYAANSGATENLQLTAASASGTIRFHTAGWSTAASERMRISTNGNVGIGTTNPTQLLTVSGSTSWSGNVGTLNLIDASVTGSGLTMTSSVSGGRQWTLYSGGPSAAVGLGSFGVFDTTSGVARLTIDPVGNVGIGTTSPDTYGKLTVYGSEPTSYSVASFNSSQYNKGVTGLIYNNDTTVGSYSGLRFVNRSANAGIWSILSISNGATDSDLIFGSLAGEALRIKNNGNVGVGTSTPARKLSVSNTNTTAYVATGTAPSAAVSLLLENPSTTNASTFIDMTVNGGNGAGRAFIGALYSGWAVANPPPNIVFGTTKNIYTEQMALSGMHGTLAVGYPASTLGGMTPLNSVLVSGSVGIGTTTPAKSLTVVGSVAIGSAANSATRGADYLSIITSKTSDRRTGIQFAQNALNTFEIGTDVSQANAQNFYIYDNIANTARILLDGNGNLGVGVTPSAYKLDVYGEIVARNGFGDLLYLGGDASGTDLEIGTTQAAHNTLSFFNRGAGTYMDIAAKNISYTGSLISASDRRLKKDIHILDHPLDKMLKVEGVSYYWKDPKKYSNGLQYGVIAQQVEEIFPNLVDTNAEGMKKVNYIGFLSPLIESLKEFYSRWMNDSEKLHRDIASIEERKADKAEIEKLKNENAELRAYLCSKDPTAPICK